MYCEIGDAVQLPYKKRRFGIWASPTGVAVVGRVVIIVIFFFAVVFLFVFFLVWLLSKEDIGSYRPIRRV
jgi:hypothetical protein